MRNRNYYLKFRVYLLDHCNYLNDIRMYLIGRYEKIDFIGSVTKSYCQFITSKTELFNSTFKNGFKKLYNEKTIK